MQNVADTIIRAINGPQNSTLSVLTGATHERMQSSGFGHMDHYFYMLEHPAFKSWNPSFAKIPNNHTMVTTKQLEDHNFLFDIVLSQNKFGQFQAFKNLCDSLNIPLISIEHTLPIPTWPKKRMDTCREMRGDINVFITPFQKEQWGWPEDDSVVFISCAVDIELFRPDWKAPKDGKVLTVVNDYIIRDFFCGWQIYKRLTQDLPTNPLGDTKGFCKPAKDTDSLIKAYQTASVFLNTSTWSTMPVSLLEAMACGCPIVTTSTCSIPDWIENGVNGFISNDENYLKDRLKWCIENPDDAKELGTKAAVDARNKFSMKKHRKEWQKVFNKAYGMAHL